MNVSRLQFSITLNYWQFVKRFIYMIYKCDCSFLMLATVYFFHLYENCIECDIMSTSNKRLNVSQYEPPTGCGTLFT